MKIPHSSYELIDELSRIYPEVLPEEGESLEHIHRRAGRRDVVKFLLDLRQRELAASNKGPKKRVSR